MESLGRERLINAIAYFAKNVKFARKVKIFKLLFLLDFQHFEATGLPVTDSEYSAWDFGPVPVELFEEIKEGAIPPDLARLVRIIQNQPEGGKKSFEFKVLDKAKIDLSVFTPRQMKIMENLVFIYKDIPGTDMSEISHLPNSPWDKTRKTKGMYHRIDYLLAIDSKSPISAEIAQERYREHKEFIENFH